MVVILQNCARIIFMQASKFNALHVDKGKYGDIGGNLNDKHGTKERYAINYSICRRHIRWVILSSDTSTADPKVKHTSEVRRHRARSILEAVLTMFLTESHHEQANFPQWNRVYGRRPCHSCPKRCLVAHLYDIPSGWAHSRDRIV